MIAEHSTQNKYARDLVAAIHDHSGASLIAFYSDGGMFTAIFHCENDAVVEEVMRAHWTCNPSSEDGKRNSGGPTDERSR